MIEITGYFFILVAEYEKLSQAIHMVDKRRNNTVIHRFEAHYLFIILSSFLSYY